MECLAAFTGCPLTSRKSMRKIRIGIALAVMLLLAQVGVLAVSVPSSDYFSFFDSAVSSSVFSRGGLGTFSFGDSASSLVQTMRAIQDGFTIADSAVSKTVLSRGLGDSYPFSDILGTALSLPRNLSDSFPLFDSAISTAALFRGLGNSYPFNEAVSWTALEIAGTFSCASQLAGGGHACSLVGTPGADTFLIDTCELSRGTCELPAGNDTVVAVGGGGADVFKITDGPGSDTYSIDSGNGNATFYVDACDGANPANSPLGFSAGVCTTHFLPATDRNSYSLVGGGNAKNPNKFMILDGPGTNIYSLTGGAGPDNFTIKGGEGNDTYAMVGGDGSSASIVAGDGTETYSMIYGSESSLGITGGSGQEQFGIIVGTGSELTLSGNSGEIIYNISY
jgi:hypothetical protein